MVASLPPPDQTCFWTGAGISADYPTCLPLGDDLTEVIVSHICGRSVWQSVREDFAAARMISASGHQKSAPRLEWAVEHLHRVVGNVALDGFRALSGAQPNDLHEFFAAHLLRGGRHITMNFDRCIDGGLSGLASGPIHLHGALSPTGLGDLRTRTLELTHGLRQEDAAATLDALDRSQLAVFIGYSGRDFFDVDPFFRALAERHPGRLNELDVLWVEHSASSNVLETISWRDAPVADGRPILQALETLGASITYARSSTRAVLAQVASAWGMVAPALVPDPRSATLRAATLRRAAAGISVAKADRLRATAVFWASMGAGRRVVELDRRLARSPDPVERETREELADTRRDGLMSVGRYRQAARLARTMNDPVRRQQRLASAYRLRGSTTRALWHLLRALSLCARQTSTDPDFTGHCGDAREGYVAWYRGARVSAAGWAIASARFVLAGTMRTVLRREARFDPVHVFKQFKDCEPYVVTHPHAVEQIARAWRDVPEFRRTGPLPAYITDRQTQPGFVFVETDHFLGHLNGERRRLASALIDSSRPGGNTPRPTVAELRHHRNRAAVQGDLPGELKAVLLERTAGHSGAPFPRSALRAVGWSPKTKALWLMNWAIRRWPYR